MRIKDVEQLKDAVTAVVLVEIAEDEWEIHFALGEGEATQKITKHFPTNEVRTWHKLDRAVTTAKACFGTHLTEFKLKILRIPL